SIWTEVEYLEWHGSGEFGRRGFSIRLYFFDQTLSFIHFSSHAQLKNTQYASTIQTQTQCANSFG
ncbi:MAG: hypothetical protein ACK5B6_07045, partial [Bacteroidia bacterium]